MKLALIISASAVAGLNALWWATGQYWHAMDRFFIHVWSGPGVIIAALFPTWLIERKTKWRAYGINFFVIPALVLIIIIFAREPFDSLRDGSLKSISDLISWVIGTGIAGWALYRLSPRLNQAVEEIRKLRQ